MNSFTLAQIFGLLGSISMFLTTWQKTRKKVLSFLIFDSLFYFIQYILLGALSGAFSNIIGLIRTVLFKYKENNKLLQKKLVLYMIIIIYLIIGITTYDGLTSIFPIAASILYSVVLWQENVKYIRIGTSIMILSWLIYNLSVGAYIGALVEGILFISSIAAIIKLDIINKHLKQSNSRKQIDKLLKQ